MDLNALRVFDSIHSLSITEEEFSDLEREQKATDRTGVYIRCVRQGYSIAVSHDENHKIIIREIKKDFPTPCRVLFKTLIPFDELPEEIYTLHAIAQYRALDTDMKFRSNNMEELKDRICERFIDNFPKELGRFYDDTHYNELHSYDEDKRATWGELKTKLIERQLRALFWLFGEDYEKFEREVKVARKNVPRIIKVFERNNRRMAIIQRSDDYEKRRGGMMYNPAWFESVKGNVLMIRCFKPGNPQYNYVDLNREMYLPNGIDETAEIWLDDDLFEKIDYPELKVFSKRLFSGREAENLNGKRWTLLTADEFNKKQTLLRIEVMSATRHHQEEEAKKALVKNIEAQFKKGKVVRQGITFTKNSIECEGVLVKNDRLGHFVMRNNIHLQREPEFSKIVKDFICFILNIDAVWSNYSSGVNYVCNFAGKETILIGKVKLCIENRKNSIFVNDHRIAKNDLVDVIFTALFHRNQNDFDQYLAYSSRVNLTLQKVLSDGGISFELKIDKTTDNELPTDEAKMILSLPLHREKNKNFTTINGTDYQIQDLNAFFDLGKDINSARIGYGGGGYLQRTIRLLYKAIKGISPKEIGEIIKNGEQEYARLQERRRLENAEKLKKANGFLAEAVRLSKAEKLKDGYLVVGKSGKPYTVNSNTLAVYDMENGGKGRYCCIVDMGTSTDEEWGRKDALAKRLLMLAHDLKVADEIHTLELEPEL
ncbi:MAG: hypothetical protein OI860_00685 (plasmid) [Candidatus Methanoperedens sp.]|uniref:hypothetical protein n=1 Tax=Candidatus Methanoperedens sp. BLZ2 TaxID=2035255 RepID=UPI000BE42B2D|nr:hypothetical protein [Candidatus Methanoperedens sp. BLZ2]MBZ0175598.1 hypothetical protein [Candidatus Methanoperedens nitroreducens]WAH95129.1 MAG: hypothetical protein OI863_00630 [Candidatus Methanoperedens sp.]WAM22311.1 MAG: hypothetical protein OI860_00685 [Candidatus Methanoperedens sp.]